MSKFRSQSIYKAHRLLAEAALRSHFNAYVVKHGVAHLIALGRDQEAIQCLLNLEKLDALCRASDTFEFAFLHWRVLGMQTAEVEYQAVVDQLIHDEGSEQLACQASRIARALFFFRLCTPGLALAEWAAKVLEQKNGLNAKSTQDAIDTVVCYYEDANRWDDAVKLLERKLSALERTNAEHPSIPNSLEVLSRLYMRLRRTYDAEALLQRALKLRKRDGAIHQNTLRVALSLASNYYAQSRYSDAEDLVLLVIRTLTTHYGEAHPATRAAARKRAYWLHAQTKNADFSHIAQHKNAFALFQRAAELHEAILGALHPLTIAFLKETALRFENTDHHLQALHLFRKVVDATERIGPPHPELLDDTSQLARKYDKANRFEDAEPLYRRELEAKEKTYGPQHAETLAALKYLATRYDEENRFVDAEPLYKREIRAVESLRGSEHPETLKCMEHLALRYDDEGRFDAAEPLLRKVNELRETRPEQHTSKAVLERLARGYIKHGRSAEAESLCKRAVEQAESEFGIADLRSIIAKENLGEFYSVQGRFEEAISWYRRVVSEYEKKLGVAHQVTCEARDQLAWLYTQQGDVGAAEHLWILTATIFEEKIGNKKRNPQTTRAINNLALHYFEHGRIEDAEHLWHRALSVARNALGETHAETLMVQMNLGWLELEHRQPKAAHVRFTHICQNQNKLGEWETIYAQFGRSLANALLGAPLSEANTTLHTLQEALGAEDPLMRKARRRFHLVRARKAPRAAKIRPRTLRTQHAQLGQVAQKWSPKTTGKLAIYALRNGPAHLLTLHRNADVERLLLDLEFMHAFRDAFDSFTTPLAHWRVLGLKKARAGYQRAASELKLHKTAPTAIAHNAHAVARIMIEFGFYAPGRAFIEWALPILVRNLGESAPPVLNASQTMAKLMTLDGHEEDAEPLLRFVVKGQIQQFGEHHPATIHAWNDLAAHYTKTSRHVDADRILRRILRTQSVSREDPTTLETCTHLADLCFAQKKYDAAESLYIRVLEAREQDPGKEHPLTLSNKHSLGQLFSRQERYNEAEKLLLDALHGRQRILGMEHPDTLDSCNAVSLLYLNMKRDDEAQHLLTQSLSCCEETYGVSHPETLNFRGNLCSLYERQFLYEKAEPLRAQNLKYSERVLGPEHDDTIFELGRLALCYFRLKRYEDAIAPYRRLLSVKEQSLGKGHSESLVVARFLAHVYLRLERFSEAAETFCRILSTQRKNLGEAHPDSQQTARELARAYRLQQEFEKAEEVLLRVAEKQVSFDDENAASFQLSRRHLADLYYEQGWADAAEMTLFHSGAKYSLSSIRVTLEETCQNTDAELAQLLPKFIEATEIQIPTESFRHAWTALLQTSSLNSQQHWALLQSVHLPFTVVEGEPDTGKDDFICAWIRLLSLMGIAPSRVALFSMTEMGSIYLHQQIQKSPLIDEQFRRRLPPPLSLRQSQKHSEERALWLSQIVDADFILIDEGSLMEADLFVQLLKAANRLRKGTDRRRLVLTGTSNFTPTLSSGQLFSLMTGDWWERPMPLDRPWKSLMPDIVEEREVGHAHGWDLNSFTSRDDEVRGRFVAKLTTYTQNIPFRSPLPRRIWEFVRAFDTGDTSRQGFRGCCSRPTALTDLRFAGVEAYDVSVEDLESSRLAEFLEKWWAERLEPLLPITSEKNSESLCLHLQEHMVVFEDLPRWQSAFLKIYNQQILTLSLAGTPICATDVNLFFASKYRGELQAHMYFAGEPVVLTRDATSLGLEAGHPGVVLWTREAAEKIPRLRVIFPHFKGAKAYDFEMVEGYLSRAYAVPIRLIQSSKAEYIALLLPDEDHPLLVQQLVRTAIRKADRSLILVGPMASFYRAARQKWSTVERMPKTNAWFDESYSWLRV